jgi:hypothetical protein
MDMLLFKGVCEAFVSVDDIDSLRRICEADPDLDVPNKELLQDVTLAASPIASSLLLTARLPAEFRKSKDLPFALLEPIKHVLIFGVDVG